MSEDVLGPATANEAPSLSTTSPEDGHPVPDSNEDLFPDFTGDLLNKGLEVPLCECRERRKHSNQDDDAFKDLQSLLPAFASPTRSQRTYRYAEFLQKQKAFEIPPPRLLQALLIRYVEFVHPHLPLVDLHPVLQAVATGGKEGTVSLMLFQAMLLAASPYVDAQYVMEAGYPNRMALRRELAERARLLYDFDCEADRLVIVQALILMTSWQERGDEVKHLRHWISIAYNIACLLGLNKEVPDSLNLPPKHRSLRKRIWWSLYMRDRTLSLGLRQWPIIAAEVCEISQPVVEDFDIHPASDKICELLQNCALLRDLDQQVRLAEVFRAQLELSHHTQEVFKARYTVVTPKLGSTHMIALVLVPKPLITTLHSVETCSEVLDKWIKKLPEKLRFRTPLSLHFDPGEDVLVLHCGILNLFYYALVCALHRPYPLPAQRELAPSEKISQRRARHAANAIFSILEEFQSLDTVCFLPTQGITFMLQGTVTALCDTTSDNEQMRTQSCRRLQTCLEILTSIRDMHSYAAYATNFLTAAATRLDRQSQSLEYGGSQREPRPTTPASSQRPVSVLAPPLPFLGTHVGHNDWTATTDSTAVSSFEQTNDTQAGLQALLWYSEPPDPGFDCETADFASSWEPFAGLL
ncbi:Fungal specific transcription factor domain-containing protein [Cladophialophora immunda]|nr:Fungal specific transcription factor domain-containing protein [Cladophialophora immunda]